MPLRHRIAAAAVAFTAFVLVSAPAAVAQPFGGRQLGPASDNKDPQQGVYVRDSAVAGEKLALAQRMERLKEWNKAADVYQEIVEKYADRVVPVPDAPDDAKRYSSVTLTVQELLGKWPEAGLSAYRARYETPAATLLEAAGGASGDDVAGLSRVVQRYFPTDAARAAGMRLIELYIENGEFAAAAWLGERLLGNHPGLAADRARLMFRTALAEHLAADDSAARAKLAELKDKFPAEKGKFRGQDVVLADALAQELKTPPAVAHGTSPDSWPTFGGDATRGRIPVAAGRPGAKLVDIPLVRPRQRPVNQPEIRAQLNAQEKIRRDTGLMLGIMPVVDRGEIFYQDNARIYAKGLESGFSLPGWTTGAGDDSGSRGRYGPMGAPPPSSAQLTVTVTENAVLAILGQPDRLSMNNDGPVPVNLSGVLETQLVCVDRTTGVKKWSISPRQFPEPLANLRTLDLGGSPLVIGDNVYVAARGGKPMQFEDSYVLCFNLADGKLRWACYLASGNAQVDYAGISASSVVSHLAYSGGRVYCVTNLGAVAAVDAYAGTIAWLTLYPRPNQNQNQAAFLMQLQRGGGSPALASAMKKPWAQNPAIVRDGRVFTIPADAQYLLIYDGGSGAEVKRMPLTDYDNASTLLGVQDEKVYIAGAKSVFCIDWKKYDPKARPSESIVWANTIPVSGGTADENKDTIRGRGFLTSDSLFLCTKTNLKRVDLAGGRVVESYPPSGSWGAGEGPGNVIVTGDQVIIAGADSIGVYSDLALARAKLDKAEQAAPTDPLPRLKYAETLFAAGQTDPAVEKLDQAIQLLGGLKSMRPGPERDRAFARSLAFAERSSDPKAGASDPAKIAGLYDRAAAAAGSPAQQVAYRLSRARFERSRREFNNEVRLLQEILLDAQWRAVLVPADDGSGPTPAAAVAEATIGQRVRDYPAAYQPYETAAAAALAAATKARDPQQMLAVAQTYPNAKVAADAMLAAADAYEAADKPRQATQMLNQAYRKYRDSTDKARIIEALARNYLRLPEGLGVAIGRLNEGAKLGLPTLQRPLKLPDGTTVENVSFAAAAELLQHYSARVAAASLPDFNIPTAKEARRTQAFLPEQPEWVINGVERIVLPPREMREFARRDRVVTWSHEGGLSIYPVGSNTAVGAVPTMRSAPRGAAWIDQDLLVWTADAVTLLKGDAAAPAWTLAVRSLSPVDALEPDAVATGGGGADDAAAGGGGAVGNVQVDVVVGGDGQAVIVDAQRRMIRQFRIDAMRRAAVQARMIRGAAAVAQPGQDPAAEHLDHVRPVGERVILGTSAGRIAAVDLSNGQVAWQTRVGEAALDQLLANDDFIATRWVDEYGAQIAALDTFTGQPVMRKTFGPDTGLTPLNLALSPDGTLIWTLPDRVCGKDLYEPGRALRFGDSPLAEGGRLFEGAVQPEQLVVAEGRILAAADQGQFIRVISLESGREIAHPLGTGVSQNNWNVWMRVVGPRVYVFNPRTLNSYNLDRPEDSPQYTPAVPPVNVRDAFIGKRHVVLLGQPMGDANDPFVIQQQNQPTTSMRLLAYARYPAQSGRMDESGRFDQDPDVKNDAGIDPQWQPVDGGFYYRSADGKAHYLKGAAAPVPADQPATGPAGGQ